MTNEASLLETHGHVELEQSIVDGGKNKLFCIRGIVQKVLVTFSLRCVPGFGFVVMLPAGESPLLCTLPLSVAQPSIDMMLLLAKLTLLLPATAEGLGRSLAQFGTTENPRRPVRHSAEHAAAYFTLGRHDGCVSGTR